jgi:hypothetical protein
VPILLRDILENDYPLKSVEDIKKLVPQMVVAAQKVYDEWQQDENGEDPELGVGGVCQDIAEAISGVLNSNGIDAATVDNGGMGEQHVWAIAKTFDGVYEVDIPYSSYERGGGYTWRKIPNVKFTPRDIHIYKLSVDPEDFEKMTDSY